jgi:hypothetical protein
MIPRHTALLLVAGLGSVVCSVARAEPYFAVEQGLKCVACHVNATGGGMRNAFGSTWGQTALPARQVSLDDRGEPWTGIINRYVGIGANLRASGSYTDVPHQDSQSEFDLDELRLYLNLSPIPERLSLYVDQRLAPGASTNLEAHGTVWFGDRRWYVKAGQMYLPYGLRLEDDTAFIRQIPGINFDTPDKGVELGYESTRWSAQLAVTNGTAGGTEVDDGKQASLRAEFVQSIWRAGASFNYNDADAGDRRMQNVFAGLRTGPIAWLAEADYIVDDGTDTGRRELWVGHLEGDWRLGAGHNLKATVEYFEPDIDVDEDEQNRYTLLWEYTPMQFVQLRVGALLYDGIPQNDLQNRWTAFVQLHGFF